MDKEKRSLRRWRRRCVIQRRLKIIRNSWNCTYNGQYEPEEHWPYHKQGVLSKHNLTCSCWMCSGFWKWKKRKAQRCQDKIDLKKMIKE